MSFLFVTLPGAFFLRNHIFQILQTPTDTLICSDLSIKSVLERLVLKNLTQRTSQRVKWTSGARVTIISFPIARSIVRSIARSLDRSLDRSPARSLARSIDRSHARSVARSIGRSRARSLAHSIGRSIARSIARLANLGG